MNKKENIILIDNEAPDDWEFLQAIEKTTGQKWKIYKEVSNENFGNAFQGLIRYGKYFIFPIKFAVHHQNYNKVLAWQQFYGLILAFYFRIFHLKNTPEIYIVSFIYKQKKSFVGKIYNKFIKYILRSNYITAFIVHSESERELYSELFKIPQSKFITIVLGDEDRTNRIKPKFNRDYFLAAGRSNRDYKFLLDFWKNRTENLKIICDTLSYKSSNNIEILNNCYEDEYFFQLANCYAVIIPLEDTNISSGQLVIIHAMMYGKPIIVTHNNTLGIYIKNQETGLIINKTEDDLSKAIEWLQDDTNYKIMAEKERLHYEEQFSFSALGTAIGYLLR